MPITSLAGGAALGAGAGLMTGNDPYLSAIIGSGLSGGVGTLVKAKGALLGKLPQGLPTMAAPAAGVLTVKPALESQRAVAVEDDYSQYLDKGPEEDYSQYADK